MITMKVLALFSLGSIRFSHAVQQLSEDCTIVAIADTRINIFDRSYNEEVFDEGYEETRFSCNGDGVSYQFGSQKLIQQLDNGGNLIINETILLKNTGVIVEGHTITSLGTQSGSIGKKTTEKRPIEGDKPILVVRVTDANGLAHRDNAATIGDKIFGTLGDEVNLKSQMSACSFGKLTIMNTYDAVDISEHLAAPGVIEVGIPISIQSNDRYTIHNAVSAAVKAKLGFSLPGPFEQVMYVLEKCYVGCGWAAYAYVNSWMSVYQADYYKYAGVQMHEIGHNFGHAHSGGLNGATYTDHTCQMGNPLYGDDQGKMCYNPAKNWAISWYNGRKKEVNINQDAFSYVETIIGIADFANNPNNRNVVVKLETGTENDYFVGFNRAIGVNSQNDEADNEVTIVQTGKNGESYSQSSLKATLKQGEFWELQEMTVTVEEINTDSNPWTAKISIKKGATKPPNPTLRPTNPPTTATVPTPNPTTTAPFSPTLSPTAKPIVTSSPVSSPVSPPTSRSCKELCCYPKDENGNGGSANDYMLSVCANKGCHYELWPDGKPYCSGKDYYHQCVIDTCQSPASPPTALPISPPTASPIKTPTVKPTVGPTAVPTLFPTNHPTASPTYHPIARNCTDVCYENEETIFLLKVKSKVPQYETCEELAKRNDKKIEKICKRERKSLNGYGPASVHCRVTCSKWKTPECSNRR